MTLLEQERQSSASAHALQQKDRDCQALLQQFEATRAELSSEQERYERLEQHCAAEKTQLEDK